MFPYPYAQPSSTSTYDCPYCRMSFPEFSAVVDHLHRKECHQIYTKHSSPQPHISHQQPFTPPYPSPHATPEHSSHSSTPPFNVDDFFIDTPTQSSHSGTPSAAASSSPTMPSSISTATSPATPRNSQKFICRLCGTALANVGNLNRHIEALHKDNRPYKCQHCPKAFHRRSERNEHMNVVHYLVKTYRCDLCPAKYSRKEHLQRHIKSDHTLPKRKRRR
ncbi:Zinc finger protein Gfi-1 [Gracilariopsis chorda]|uniref:Zinc finger protein Gfi-1 n=1 Tax=Gracilariopsis chorda TaxID=448386 RepID=A0A2V3IYR5_9FLOR|nr:Zinc finger protein Gfi-1 [Gracilariopsis chorda]|eukprot:PXF46827.1 Zinc finger protein Gfi-1 [Gracilariopsis chorda]